MTVAQTEICPRCESEMQPDCPHDVETDIGVIHVQCHWCPWCSLRYQAVEGGAEEAAAIVRYVKSVAGPCDDPLCDACSAHGTSTEREDA